MSATSAPVAAPAEVVEQPSEVPVVAEAATEVEIEQEQAAEEVSGGQEIETASPPEIAPAFSQAERDEAAARIRAGAMLPPALRDCLARVVAASAETAADGTVRVPLDAAIRAVAEALPEFLRREPSQPLRPEHPGGEAFFHGDPAELSDADAEAIARAQLARSGLLRGQKVRVAE